MSKLEAAGHLANKFWNLVGAPAKYANDTIKKLWTEEFLHILNQPEVTEEYVVKVLAWVFTDSFWCRCIYTPKNVSDNWDTITDKYEAELRAKRLEEKTSSSGCTCPTIEGSRFNMKDGGRLLPYDGECSVHKSKRVGEFNIKWVNRPGWPSRKDWEKSIQ